MLMEHKWSERQLINSTLWKREQAETSQTMDINQSSEEDKTEKRYKNTNKMSDVRIVKKNNTNIQELASSLE